MALRNLLCLSLLGLVACSPDARVGDAPVAVARGADLAVDSVPLLDIRGTVTPDSAAFLLAVAGVRLSNGVIAVADLYDAAIRFFDPEGRLIRKVGRRGDGPTEFQNVTWLGRCAADSVFVWDASLFRLTVLDLAGRVGRATEIEGNPAMVRCSRGGTFGAFLGPRNVTRFGPERWAYRYAMQLWLLDARGDTIRSLGEMPIGELRPLGRVTQLALADDRVYVGTADSAYVDVFGLGGRRLASLALGIPARAPTSREYERAIDAMVRPFPGRADRESIKRNLLDIPMPDLAPPYTGLFVDPAGTLWVETSAPGEPATQLLAIA
ncbi:MAG TPA: hypothetical protein VF158_14725 [Longimicrobiales bacterium]